MKNGFISVYILLNPLNNKLVGTKVNFYYLTVDRPLMCDCESPRANSVHSLLITIINVSLLYWILVND